MAPAPTMGLLFELSLGRRGGGRPSLLFMPWAVVVGVSSVNLTRSLIHKNALVTLGLALVTLTPPDSQPKRVPLAGADAISLAPPHPGLDLVVSVSFS